MQPLSKPQAQTLTFNRADVHRLLIHTRNASSHAGLPFSGTPPGTAQPALWLVSGHGIYLRSNGTDESGLLNRGTGAAAAFALEADPDRTPFDDWWAIKSRIFQGDGYMDLSLDSITRWLAQTFDTPRIHLEGSDGNVTARLLSDFEALNHDH